jgi:subtilisin family serine protease
LLAAAVAAVFFAGVAHAAEAEAPVEVVVTLDAPPLASAIQESRVLSARTKARRLDLRSPTSVDYLRELARTQHVVEARIRRAIPSARVRWHYGVVLNGFAVVVQRAQLHQLSAIPGVALVYAGGAYCPLLDQSPELIGANQLWGPDLSTAGQGVKIAILDQGIDQKHPFFNPAGFAYPPGFPKGNPSFTTPKVIVARAFAPASTTWKYARVPYDPLQSSHGDHVAGIAAGDAGIIAIANRGPLSGVAPKAYLGNYKVAGVPTPAFGLDANAPEIAAGIEAAVKDGMDVINLSFGEPEVTPGRDVVVQAFEGAADAGVVSTVAANNDFDSFGRGSISSPANAPSVISVAAVDKNDRIASFSSSGPTPISLELKPDVSAPGVSILSSVPPREGTWTSFNGTSMAAPHVAGAAALLRQRHPNWTVAQIKSALVLTGDPVFADSAHKVEVPTTREGGGLIDLPRADNPLVFAAPTSLSFGLLKSGTQVTRSIVLTDAGGGGGDWAVTVEPQQQVPGLTVSAPATETVPGGLVVSASVTAEAPEVDATGFLVLQRGSDRRRIPYWLRAERPRLERPSATLTQPGTYSGDTRGKPARVASYRYPDDPSGAGVSNELPGPEQVFRVRVTRNVANFGVVILSQGRGVRVTPRVVASDDENRLTGYPGLPVNINPYLETTGDLEPIAGAILPAPGIYDVVFDTSSAASAGPFKFRFWVNDVTPPSIRLLTPVVKPLATIDLAAADAGSGVDPKSLEASIDGKSVHVVFARGRIQIPVSGAARGRHSLVLHASDYQEAKNMEDVLKILPNTLVFRASFRVK